MADMNRNPTGKGGFQKGKSGNAGGRTSEEIKAAKALNAVLRGDDFQKAAKESYLALLKDRNPIILKDYMDRVAGKARDMLEVSGPEGSPLSGITSEDLRAFVLAKRGG